MADYKITKLYYSRKTEIKNLCIEIFILAYLLVSHSRTIINKIINKYNRPDNDADSLMVLGTGPSLSKTIKKLVKSKNKYTLMAVNNFPLSEHFSTLKPSYLCFIDSMYWVDINKLDPSVSKKVEKVYKNLDYVDWKMTLFVPTEAKSSLLKRLKNTNLIVKYIRCPRYDFDSTTVASWSLYLGILPPRVNVAVTAIYLATNLGYKKIKVAGVDMDRIKDLQVDQESNETGTQVDYFYKNEEKPFLAVHKLKDQKGLPVHIRLMRESSTFKWFSLVNSYSTSKSVNLCNASEYSFIDSMERCKF